MSNENSGLMLFRVTADEAKKHFTERTKFYEERAQKFMKEAQELDEKMQKDLEEAKTVTDRIHMKSGSSFNELSRQRDNAREKARQAARSAVMFKWYGDHFDQREFAQFISRDEALTLEFFAGEVRDW